MSSQRSTRLASELQVGDILASSMAYGTMSIKAITHVKDNENGDLVIVTGPLNIQHKFFPNTTVAVLI